MARKPGGQVSRERSRSSKSRVLPTVRSNSLPLSRRARIEVYLVVDNSAGYKLLLDAIEREFINTFGGCTVIRGAKGLYLSHSGDVDADDIDLIYADTP